MEGSGNSFSTRLRMSELTESMELFVKRFATTPSASGSPIWRMGSRKESVQLEAV